MNLESTSQLKDLFQKSIEDLSRFIEKVSQGKSLLGIGLVTSDDISGIAGFFLIEGDLPEGSEVYQRYSPVEWLRSEAECFKALNDEIGKLASKRRDSDWVSLVRELFGLCAETMERLDLRKQFGGDVFLSFCSSDPCDFMIQQESQFVQRMNSPEVFSEWQIEFE